LERTTCCIESIWVQYRIYRIFNFYIDERE
jgi:hypothetical protein